MLFCIFVFNCVKTKTLLHCVLLSRMSTSIVPHGTPCRPSLLITDTADATVDAAATAVNEDGHNTIPLFCLFFFFCLYLICFSQLSVIFLCQFCRLKKRPKKKEFKHKGHCTVTGVTAPSCGSLTILSVFILCVHQKNYYWRLPSVFISKY